MLYAINRLQLAPAAAGFLLSGALLVTPVTQAAEFEVGEAKGSLNTTISLGARYNLEEYSTPTNGDGEFDGEENENDGNRSFDQGFVSQTLKLTSEFKLEKNGVGFFARATAYHDRILMDDDNNWADANATDIANGLADQTGTYSGLTSEVKRNQGNGVKLQSAYAFANWKFGESGQLDIRLGDQTIGWGETLFYGGGLKNLNAYDLALNSLPGSDGDLLLPQGMIQIDLALNDQLKASAYAQYDSKESISGGHGTFDSGTDLFVPGSDYGYKSLNTFANLAGMDVPTFKGLLGQINGALAASGLDGYDYETGFISVADVSGTTNASDTGQWGLRLTYEPEFLKDTEFAVYYSNYHSSIQYVEANIANDPATLGGAGTAFQTMAQSTFAQLTAAGVPADVAMAQAQGAGGLLGGLYLLNQGTTARTAYPEDIKLWGASFHTKVFGYTQIAGELTYKENAPIYIDHPDDILSMMLAGTGSALTTGQIPDLSLAVAGRSYTLGDWYQNYERVPMIDGSLSVIQPFGAVLGTDLMYVVSEAAFQQVNDLENYDRYTAKGAPAWFGDDPEKEADERLDKFSWGYNLLLGANWEDVATPGLTIKSTFRWTHDVSGNSTLTGRFEEDTKKIDLGVSAEYKDFGAKLAWGGDSDDMSNGTLTGSVNYSF